MEPLAVGGLGEIDGCVADGGLERRAASSSASHPRSASPRRTPFRPGLLVERLAAARIGSTFNQYACSELLRRRLCAHLERDADVVLVGEAAGYRGARVSGIAFTSERQLTGAGPAEATATIVHRLLAELGLEESVLLWNVVPTHPGTETSNRRPTREEIEAARPFLDEVVRGRRALAVGRVAAEALGGPYLRHPSHGGGREFARGLRRALVCKPR